MPKEQSFELWLEFENWESKPDEDLTNDFFNMTIQLEDNSKYALNVWTFNFINDARYPWPHEEDSGEKVDYLLPPDLFVERMDRALIQKIVGEMIQNNELLPEWRVEEDET